MSNLIINNISIISPDTQKAKFQEFTNGINLVLGDENSGNFIGKSSLLRSIFHTLGADSKYNKNEWEKEGAYIYILDFNFNNKNYKMLRKQELFKLYENNKILFSVINREELSLKLSEIFLQEIYLLNYENKYTIAPPVFSYLLNYIEQTEIKLCDFRSFNNLTAFPRSNYSDLLYELVGSNSREYNDLVKTLKEAEEKLKQTNKQNSYLKEILEEIDKNNTNQIAPNNLDVLKKTMNDYKEEYSRHTNNANKIKKELYTAYNLKAELETIIGNLRESIKEGNSINNKILKEHTCPTCQSELYDSKGYFVNSNNIENYKFQLIDLEKELANIDRNIKLTSDKYEANLKDIEKLDKKIFGESKEIEDQLSYIGLRQLKTKVNIELIDLSQKIEKISEEIKAINKRLREHRKVRIEIDEYYIETLTNKSFDYNIRIPSLDRIKKLDDILKSDGNEIMLATVTWLTSLLETKYKYNPKSTIYPLVYDNPNNANFDKDNDTKIFKLIFDSLPKNGQIITSTVGFTEELFAEYKINKISLMNKKYSLLNAEDYKKCLEILENL